MKESNTLQSSSSWVLTAAATSEILITLGQNKTKCPLSKLWMRANSTTPRTLICQRLSSLLAVAQHTAVSQKELTAQIEVRRSCLLKMCL